MGDMTLAEITTRVEGATLLGDGSVVPTGVQHDSREVAPGDVFVCLVGDRFDGHAFVGDAVARGAVAVAALEGRALQPRATLEKVPVLLAPDTRAALARIACAVYGEPSRSMRTVAATGTNGKSTTVAMVAAIAEAAGLPSGRIGTLGARAMGKDLPCAHTTPEADDLQRLLAQMRDMGVRLVAMEVSSHGLVKQRTDGVAFAAAVFTNLTQDHLDFHGTMDDYFAAKLRLFTDYADWADGEMAAVVNLDDPRGCEVAAAARGRVITFGTGDVGDIRARGIAAEPHRTRFATEGIGGPMEIVLPIGGSFQVSNALGAIGAAVSLDLPREAMENGLASLEPVPGRFEAVETGRDWHVIVDFAHTPNGLETLIASARALGPQRLILVFGCGGNRDRTKRPLMGSIAGRGADIVVVTSDNPRHEDPEAIIADVLDGMRDAPARVFVEADRQKATRVALEQARPGDLVLLAGKGGETVTIVGDDRIPYDDRIVVSEILGEMP